MKSTITNEVLMIRPAAFQFNAETAVNNQYQHVDEKSPEAIQVQALQEFDAMVASLRELGITVQVLEDTATPPTPDSIFPNNWFSTHEGKTMVLYPMFAENRRQEVVKHRHTVEALYAQKHGEFATVDFLPAAEKNHFLEGTGSMVLDRKNKVAYAALSPRTEASLFHEFCKALGYRPMGFHAFQDGEPIYHTNVMMSIGEKLCFICLEAIVDDAEAKLVKESLLSCGKQIVEISMAQVKLFLGNMLELKGKGDRPILLMSDTAYHSLTPVQQALIEKHLTISHHNLSTIEYYGGGSARCMVAEIF